MLGSGAFYGVTTNPTLVERAGGSLTRQWCRDACAAARDAGARELQLQAWGDSPAALAACGEWLGAQQLPGLRVVVKVPLTADGTAAAAALVAQGVPVTLTAAYAPFHAAVASAVGAEYVAPYLGRMNDAGRAGHDSVVAMQSIADTAGERLRVLVASVRSVRELGDLCAQGVDTFTLPPAVAAQLFEDPLTLKAAADFDAAAQRVGADTFLKREPGPEGAESG